MYFLSADSLVFKSCITYKNIHNYSVLLPFKRRSEIWVPVNWTWERQDGLSKLARIVQEEIQMSKKWDQKFLGYLIFTIFSAVIILTTASVAVTGLIRSIQAAHTIRQALTSITKELQTQENIDK